MARVQTLLSRIPKPALTITFFLWDILFLILAFGSIAIIVTGGGEAVVFGELIRFHSAWNPLAVFFVLFPLRFLAGRSFPFLGMEKWDLKHLTDKLINLFNRTGERLTGLEHRDLVRLLLAVITAAAVLKISNAWRYYGFYSGDDVEVLEMVFARLFDWDWRAWNLRSPFYPFVFILPPTALMKGLGVTDPGVLIFVARLVVIAFSSLNILLVFRLTRRLSSTPPALLATFFFAFSRSHITLSASVLPRTVSTFFILLAALRLTRKPCRDGHAWIAGLFLGIGGAIRFSEAIFIVPCLIYLIMDKRFRHAVIVTLSASLSGLVIIAGCDRAYWGSPFFSLTHIVDYTLVKGMSSRGYQSVVHYFTRLGEWTNIFLFIPAVLATLKRRNRLWIWFLAPLILLSFLPHKEARYLVPLLPFHASLAGIYFWEFWLHKVRPAAIGIGKRRVAAGILALCLAGGLAFETAGYRFRRSESGVNTARHLRSLKGIDNLAVEQSWRMGGRLYLEKDATLIDIDPDRIGDAGYFKKILDTPGLQAVGLKAVGKGPGLYTDELSSRGFREISRPSTGARESYRLFLRANH